MIQQLQQLVKQLEAVEEHLSRTILYGMPSDLNEKQRQHISGLLQKAVVDLADVTGKLRG